MVKPQYTLPPTARLALDAIERAPAEIASLAIHDYVFARLPWLSRVLYGIGSTWYDLHSLEDHGLIVRREARGGYQRGGRPIYFFRVAR